MAESRTLQSRITSTRSFFDELRIASGFGQRATRYWAYSPYAVEVGDDHEMAVRIRSESAHLLDAAGALLFNSRNQRIFGFHDSALERADFLTDLAAQDVASRYGRPDDQSLKLAVLDGNQAEALLLQGIHSRPGQAPLGLPPVEYTRERSAEGERPDAAAADRSLKWAWWAYELSQTTSDDAEGARWLDVTAQHLSGWSRNKDSKQAAVAASPEGRAYAVRRATLIKHVGRLYAAGRTDQAEELNHIIGATKALEYQNKADFDADLTKQRDYAQQSANANGPTLEREIAPDLPEQPFASRRSQANRVARVAMITGYVAAAICVVSGIGIVAGGTVGAMAAGAVLPAFEAVVAGGFWTAVGVGSVALANHFTGYKPLAGQSNDEPPRGLRERVMSFFLNDPGHVVDRQPDFQAQAPPVQIPVDPAQQPSDPGRTAIPHPYSVIGRAVNEHVRSTGGNLGIDDQTVGQAVVEGLLLPEGDTLEDMGLPLELDGSLTIAITSLAVAAQGGPVNAEGVDAVAQLRQWKMDHEISSNPIDIPARLRVLVDQADATSTGRTVANAGPPHGASLT